MLLLHERRAKNGSRSLPVVTTSVGFFASILLVCGFIRIGNLISFRRNSHDWKSAQLVRRQNVSDTTSTYDICRFFDHSSAIVGNKLLVEGGLFTTGTKRGERIWAHHGVMTIDLSSGFSLPVKTDSGFVSRENLPQGYTATTNGILWAVSGGIVKFGGRMKDQVSFPDPGVKPTIGGGFWKCDIGTGEFTQFTPNGNSVYGEFCSAYASDIKLGLGFAVGGVVDYETDARLPVTGLQDRYSDSLLLYDSTMNTITNKTISSFSPLACASVVHIPPSEKSTKHKSGLLVVLGGAEGPRKPWGDVRDSDIRTVLLDKVWIYDIDNDKWFSQKTSGSLPAPRISSCTVVAFAGDRSSINIIMHGGGQRNKLETYSDTYVLSLPSFKWIKVNDGGSQSRRITHTCHIVRGNQMLVIGGRGPDQDTTIQQTSIPGNWKGAKMEECDSGGMLNIMDINQFQWQTEFKTGVDNEEYKVNKAIFSEIGGTSSGGAVTKSPIGGWDDPSLEQAFNDIMATSHHDNNSNRIAIIVGAVLGSVMLITLIVLLVIYFKRGRKSKDKANTTTNSTQPKHSPPAYSPPTNIPSDMNPHDNNLFLYNQYAQPQQPMAYVPFFNAPQQMQIPVQQHVYPQAVEVSSERRES